MLDHYGGVLLNVALFLYAIIRFRRQTHVTPKSYLSFLDGYKSIYKEKHSHVGELAERMNTGLDKLMEATQSVDLLSKDLVVKERELAVANKKADAVCDTVLEDRFPSMN